MDRKYAIDEKKVGICIENVKLNEIAKEGHKDQIRLICGQIDRYLKKEPPHKMEEKKM